MAAGNFNLYSNAVLSITQGGMNLASDTFIMALLTNSYVPAADTHATWADVSGFELATGNGYTAGGLVLASETDTLTAATVKFTAASPAWTSFSAGPFRYGVIARRSGGSLVAGDKLLCFSDLSGGGTITGAGGGYSVVIGTTGIFTVTHTP